MPSFKIIGLPFLEKTFEGFLIRYGQGGHPRPVIWTIDIKKNPLQKEAPHEIWL